MAKREIDPNWRERLGLPPLDAAAVINVGKTKLYELMKTGQLETYAIGTHRRVKVSSLKAFAEKEAA